MRRSSSFLAVAGLAFAGLAVAALGAVLGGTLGHAAEGPLRSFAVQMQNVRSRVDVAGTNVKSAIAARDYMGWFRTHDAYERELGRAQGDIERACSQLMLSTLAAKMPLDDATLEAIDLASAQAANYARHKVIVHAYGQLTKDGVRYDKRSEALALLQRQGIYEQDAGAFGIATSTSTGSAPPPITDNPMHGKVPTTAEAGEILSRWQTTVMKAQAAAQRVGALEADLVNYAANDPKRPKLEQRLAASQQQYVNLLRQAEELRKKYYAAGGQ